MQKPKSTSNWYRRVYRDLSKSGICKAIKLIEESDFVVIFRSDEAWGSGDFHWIVAPGEDTTFWLDSFKSKDKAVALCDEMGWSYEIEK